MVSVQSNGGAGPGFRGQEGLLQAVPRAIDFCRSGCGRDRLAAEQTQPTTCKGNLIKAFATPLFLGCLAILAASSTSLNASAQTRTIRVVTYNIEDDINGATTPLPGLISPSGGGTTQQGGVLEGIGEEILGSDPAQPMDILALEETTSNPTTIQPIVNGLNAFYSSRSMSPVYAMSTYQATESGGDVADGNGPNAMVYNTTTVQLLASVPVDPLGGTSKLGSSSGEYREVMRYEFAPAGVTPTAANEFYVYVSHYKSGTSSADLTDRGEEAVIIRNDEANNLPASAQVLYVGDYNVTTSSESSYQTILAANAPNGGHQGQGIDPLNTSGATGINWGVNSLLNMKSESATDLRYRDDLEVMTSNIYNDVPGGLSLVTGTYHVFGNNGTTPYQGTVVSGSDTALNTDLEPSPPISASQLYSDLSTGSDHLPVVADYTVPLIVAAFSGSPVSGSAPLTVSFSNTSSDATNYAWTFGDGNTSTLASPSDTYTNPGTYSVTLVAVGPGGTNVLARNNYIIVGYPPPVTAFNGSPTSGTAPLTVSFSNTSAGATNYAWDFGDGDTSALTNPSETYTNPGNYSVTLTAVGPGGTDVLTMTNYVLVAFPPPAAAFNGGPTNGVAPLTVSFTNLSIGATNYAWDFGDGDTGALTNPSETYTNPGSYSVTLTAVGPGGTNVLTLTNYIVASVPPLPALGLGNLLFSPTVGFQFVVSNSDGSPITPDQMSRIAIFAAADPAMAFSNWTMLTNPISISNGVLQLQDTNAGVNPQMFYRATEVP
jgi:PKD repeat protein